MSPPPCPPGADLQTAIVTRSDGASQISHKVSIPSLGDGMVLVKAQAVGINPCDFKMPAKCLTDSAIVGCDFAGVICATGPGVVRDLKIGDRVAGGVHGSNPAQPLGGAFAEYISAYADILFKIPDEMTWAQAAALGGTSLATCCLALWEHGLDLQGTPEAPAAGNTMVLVNGGSTATGTMVLQLLKLSGFTTITTCSANNFELARAYGADHVFDYSSPSCSQDIKKLTRNSLFYVLDVLTDAGTVELCHGAIGRAGGRYIGLENLPGNCESRITVTHDWVLGITVFGRDIMLDDDDYERKANPLHLEAGRRFFILAEKLVREGKLRPHPPRVLSGRWEAILSGIEMKRQNKVSGEKLVVLLADQE